MLKTVTLSSLHRVFPDECPENKGINRFSCLKDEPLSFQIAFKGDGGQAAYNVNVRIDSDLPISFYYAEPIPVIHHDVTGLTVPSRAGMYPDILVPKSINPPLKNDGFWHSIWFEEGEAKIVTAVSDAWQTLWFTVNERGEAMSAGDHSITVTFLHGHTGQEIGKEELKISILDCVLVPQTLYCTNWFHCDCVCDAHGIELFSDEFFAAVGNYAEKAALNGQNMLLTPCFTPPLDTPVGGERKTVQLVTVTVTDQGDYKFDFSLLERYILTCQRAGIKYFEHNHLFTQWGAKAAPKIMAYVKGELKQIFGWDAPADSKAYKDFLSAYLPAVCDFFKKMGLEKNVLFHISDEPSDSMIDTYKAALDTVGDLLDGFMVGDALSHVELYDKGLVKMPIVATNFVKDFSEKCDNFWCYYTDEQIQGLMSNRLPVVSAERNRMIGVQMYALNIKGFLHWGYNYYYDQLSHGYTNPCLQPGVYLLSCGTSYLVYPTGKNDCYQSIRQKVFGEGLTDMRALQTLEKLCGREKTESLLQKHFGKVTFETGPETPEQYLAFRNELNEEIKKSI